MPTATKDISDNLSAFLSMICASEGSAIDGSDNGYNTIVGDTLFTDYSDHPRQRVWIPRINDYSTAAGRYQTLERFFDAYKISLGLPDFSPLSQDKIALQMIRECHASADIEAGNLAHAINLCCSRWASLPGANYGQHEQKMAFLSDAFTSAGGTVA